MKFQHLLSASLLALGLASGGAHAATNLLNDGDFESFAGQVANGSYTAVNAGTLGAWTVGATSVDLIRNAYGSISNVSVDLSGTPGPGSLSQNFFAQAGTTYTLSWDYFKNGVGTALDVSFGGLTTTYAAPSIISHGLLSWTATASGLQTVTFAGGNGNQGPTLDNVMLTAAVPEPQTYALLLAGLGVIGFVARRRRA